MPRLIITADDFGACDFIDNGIIKALAAGKINTVSAFACFPDSAERIQQLFELKERGLQFQIGLHFSITAGQTLQDSPNTLTLTGSNNFRPMESFSADHINDNDLRIELQEQLNKLKNILGDDFEVDHITNHHGSVYFNDKLFTIFKEFAKDHNLPVRSPMSMSNSGLPYIKQNERVPALPAMLLPIKKEALTLTWKAVQDEIAHLEFPNILALMKSASKEAVKAKTDLLAAEGVKHPQIYDDTFYGQANLNEIHFTLDTIQAADIDAELMLHLGDPDAAVPDDSPPGINQKYFAFRQRECNTILALDFTAFPGIQHIQYSGL